MGYNSPMKVRWTLKFEDWVHRLKDEHAKGRIGMRLKRLGEGNFGQARSLGRGLSELKIDYGPGYRIYFTRRGDELVVLLCGGDKSTQDRDISVAFALLDELER
jgi:putative addiction module killer protein